MNGFFLIIILFLAATSGVLCGIYTGMALNMFLLDPRKNTSKGEVVSKISKTALQTKHRIADNMKEHLVNRKKKIEEPEDREPDDETHILERVGEPVMAAKTSDNPEDIVEETDTQDEDMEEEDDVSHSYMGFSCENLEQNAVSRIRAARKTQDDKYINRMKKIKDRMPSGSMGL